MTMFTLWPYVEDSCKSACLIFGSVRYISK